MSYKTIAIICVIRNARQCLPHAVSTFSISAFYDPALRKSNLFFSYQTQPIWLFKHVNASICLRFRYSITSMHRIAARIICHLLLNPHNCIEDQLRAQTRKLNWFKARNLKYKWHKLVSRKSRYSEVGNANIIGHDRRDFMLIRQLEHSSTNDMIQGYYWLSSISDYLITSSISNICRSAAKHKFFI